MKEPIAMEETPVGIRVCVETLSSPPWGRGWPAAGVLFSRRGPGEGVPTWLVGHIMRCSHTDSFALQERSYSHVKT